MEFQVAHPFPHLDPVTFEAVYFDEGFNEDLCKHLGLQRQLIARTLNQGQLQRIVNIAPMRDLPGPVASILGGQKLAYREILDYTLGSMRGTWRIEPALMPDKIQSGGHFTFEPLGKGTRRIFAGQVQVKIFGLGKMVETIICSDIERSYEQAAQFTTTWLNSHPMPATFS